LGSASQALGENLEKQRANELPVAQQRAQLALMKNQMAQNQKAVQLEQERIAKKLPITAEYVNVLTNTAPDSPQAKAASAALTTLQKERELASGEQSTRSNQYTQALTAINSKWAAGGYPDKQAYQNALSAAESAFGPGSTGYKLPGANATVEPGAPLPVAETGNQTNTTVQNKTNPAAGQSNAPVGNTKPARWTGSKLPDNELKQFEQEAAQGKPGVKEMLQSYYAANPDSDHPVLLHSPYESMGYDPETTKKMAQRDEELATDRFKSLSLGGVPEVNGKMLTNANSLIKYIQNNKKLHDESFGLLQNKGDDAIWAGIQAGINKGVQFALGNPLTASISVALPIEEMKTAGLDKQHRDYLQTVSNYYAKLKADQQRISGVNPNAASNYEASLYSMLTPGGENTADSAINIALHHRADVQALGDQWKFINDVNRNKHPSISLSNSQVPDRLATIMNSDHFAKIYDPYNTQHQQIDEAFQKKLNTKGPR
jgi:hypothetical protein